MNNLNNIDIIKLKKEMLADLDPQATTIKGETVNTTKNDELKKKIKVNAKVSANYNNFKGVITKIENNIVYIKITEDKDFEGKANLKGKTDKIHFLIGEHNKTYWPYWEVTEEPIKKHTVPPLLTI